MPEGLDVSLSDRLQKVRTQQLIDAGLVPGEASPAAGAQAVSDAVFETLPATVAVADEAGTTVDERPPVIEAITIEARPGGLHLVAEATVDLTSRPDGAHRSSCPTCNARGKADMVDLVGHTVHYTCPACSTMWQVRKNIVADKDVR